MRDIAPISRFTNPGRLIYIYLGWSFVCIFEDVFVNVIVLPSVHQLFLYAEVFSEIQHQFKRIDIDLLNFLEINKRDYEIHFVYKDKNRIYENTQICQRLIFTFSFIIEVCNSRSKLYQFWTQNWFYCQSRNNIWISFGFISKWNFRG